MSPRSPLLRLAIAASSIVLSSTMLLAQPTPASTHKFQFGATRAAPGYTLVAPTAVFAAETGHGFEPGAALRAVSAANENPLHSAAVTSNQPFAFSVAVPEGNYRVTVTLGDPTSATVTTIKAERRRLMFERVQTEAGKFTTRTFAVNVRTPKISTGGQVNLNDREKDPATGAITTLSWDEKLTIGFSNTHAAVAALVIERAPEIPTFFITGDSTVTDQGRGGSWGQIIPRWFGPGIAVANYAESGETLRGFLKHRRWDKLVDTVRTGDFVLIEFGTNDSKNSGPQNLYAGQDFSETYAEAATTYRELLKRFVADVQAKGATALIASPSARRGETANPSSLGEYAVAAMATARELGVTGIDLNTMGLQLNLALGAEADLQFSDRTHHSEYGAYMQAKCIALGIQQSNLPLAKFLREDFGAFAPTRPEPTPANLALPVDGPAGGGGRRGGAGAGPAPATP